MDSQPGNSIKSVLVTGGAGYVGAVLVPKLLDDGYRVRVLELFVFGEEALDAVKDHPGLELVRGDLRDPECISEAVQGCDAVIHLACISNDPSFELDPGLGRSINYEPFTPLVRLAKESGVRRFIYASSSSVYGVSAKPDVTEEHPLEPLTDYSRFKALCEPILLDHADSTFTAVIVRPATVCGWSPRLRLDLTVNILTNLAVHKGAITVFGGAQMRPNIHIDDMADLYRLLLKLPAAKVANRIYNAGYQNHTVAEIAGIVKRVVESRVPGRERVEVKTTPTNDLRSYHISSEKIRRELGFSARRSIEDAVVGLVDAFQAGLVQDPLSNPRYYNIKTVQSLLPRLLREKAVAVGAN